MKIYLKDIMLIILFCLIAFNVYLYFDGKKSVKNYKDIKIVENSTDYYNVIGIVNKVINASNDNKKNELIRMIDSNFIRNNHLNKNNIFNKVKKVDEGHYSFSSQEMYFEKLSTNLLKYYVSGKIVVQTMDGNDTGDDYYLEVIVDKKHNTFSIIPDDGTVYREVQKNEL